MARKSRVNRLKEAAPEEEILILAGEYGRLSVEDGDDIEQNSIGNQQKITLHYLEEHPEIKLVDTYYDNGWVSVAATSGSVILLTVGDTVYKVVV